MKRAQGEGWIMFHCDFREVVADIACDVVITDPPYLGAAPTGKHDGIAKANRGRATAVPKAFRNGAGAQMMEYAPATEALLSALVRETFSMPSAPRFIVAANDFPGLAFMSTEAASQGWKVSKQPVVWVRKRALPTGYLWRPRKDCEFLMVAARTNVKAELPCVDSLPGYYECYPPREATQHVVGQKPVHLMRAIVRDYTWRGMTVFDPFAGSGTTGIAALQEGRKFVGCELDRGRFELSCERLAAPVHLSLFDE